MHTPRRDLGRTQGAPRGLFFQSFRLESPDLTQVSLFFKIQPSAWNGIFQATRWHHSPGIVRLWNPRVLRLLKSPSWRGWNPRNGDHSLGHLSRPVRNPEAHCIPYQLATPTTEHKGINPLMGAKNVFSAIDPGYPQELVPGTFPIWKLNSLGTSLVAQ